MKKIICALLGGFLSANAFGATGVANPDDVSVRVNIPWRFIEAVLRENADLVSDIEYMHAEYDKRVAASDDGKLTTADMLHICTAGRIIHNSVVCYDRVVLPVFNKMGAVMWSNACADKNIKNHAHCVGGLFSKSYGIKSGDSVKNYKTTLPYAQDVNVPQYTAFGFAIEYIRDQGFELDNIQCTPTITDNWINCTAWHDSTSMNSDFFSFHFAGVHNTKDATIEENVVRGLCALNKADFMENDCGTFAGQREKESDCRMGCDTNCTGTYDSNENSRRFHNQIQRFNLKSDYSANSIIQRIPGNNNPVLTAREDDKRFCKIWIPEKWGGGDAWNGDVRRYPGYEYMSDAFKDVQVVYDDVLKNILEAYVRAQGVEVNSFECRWLPANYSGTLIEGMAGPADNIATCDINGVPVDFIFDDLFESKNKQLVIGKDALKCLLLPRQAGGTASFDGKYCKGPDKAQCTELGKKVNGGTRWDEGTGFCVMKNAAAAKMLQDGLVCAGVGVFAAGVTVVSGGTSLPVLLSAAGTGVKTLAGCVGVDLALDGLLYLKDKARHDDVKEVIQKIEDCKLPSDQNAWCNVTQNECVQNVMAEALALAFNFYDEIGDEDINLMDEALKSTDVCTGGESDAKWDSQMYAEVVNMVPQKAALFRGKHVWFDAVVFSVAALVVFMPTKAIKAMPKWLRLSRVFKKSGVTVSQIDNIELFAANGKHLQAINVGDVTGEQLPKLLAEIEKKGFKYMKGSDFKEISMDVFKSKFTPNQIKSIGESNLQFTLDQLNNRLSSLRNVDNNRIYLARLTDGGEFPDIYIRLNNVPVGTHGSNVVEFNYKLFDNGTTAYWSAERIKRAQGAVLSVVGTEAIDNLIPWGGVGWFGKDKNNATQYHFDNQGNNGANIEQNEE